MKKLALLLGLCLLSVPLLAQNYVQNGSFEYGMNNGWTHQTGRAGEATFSLDQDKYVMDGGVGLRIDVVKPGRDKKEVKSTVEITTRQDSLYLLRFWARGRERSKMLVEVEGSETPAVLYEMHQGRTFFHLPFKAKQKNLKINFYYQDFDVTYNLDGVEVIDQDNKQRIDVLNTYIWQHNRSGLGWTAGDNDVSYVLPDGRTIWFFNDSFYGTNDITKNPLYDIGTFIRNAVVVQELDGSLTTFPVTEQVAAKDDGKKYGGGQWTYFEVPDPLYNYDEEKDEYSLSNCFWVGDAIMENDSLKVYLIEVNNGAGTQRSYLGYFSYPELKFLGIERQAEFCIGYETMFVEDETIYLYKSDGFNSHVARTPLGNLIGKNPWEYWNGTTWTPNSSESVPVSGMFADGFMKIEDGNYAHVSMPPGGREVQVAFAPAPQGPWTERETVFTAPQDSNYWFYMPNFHAQLPNGNYSISYSNNATEGYKLFFHFEAFVDKYWYRQRYLQVDLLGMSPFTRNKKDCAGVVNGEAYLDECEECVGGTTGKEPCVKGIMKLFAECNHTGDRIGLDAGSYTMADLVSRGFSDNSLSSFDLDDNYLVELFDGDNFTGDSKIFNASSACLADQSFDNKTTSLIIRRKGVINLAGAYAIQNKHTGLYWGMENNSSSNHALLVQTAYTDDDAQKFKFEYIGDNYYNIVNTASNMPVSAVNLSSSKRARYEQWDGQIIEMTNLEGKLTAQHYDSPVGEELENVIDNDTNTKYLTFNSPSWIQFESPKPRVLTEYSITSGNDIEIGWRDPTAWTLYGSNDGEKWDKLDTRSGISFPEREQEKTFSVKTTTAYSHYRIDIRCAFGNVLQLSEWKLFAKMDPDEDIQSRKFVLQDAGDGYFKIINKQSDLPLEVVAGLRDGGNVWQIEENGLETSLWKLVPASVTSIDGHTVKDEIKVYPNPVKDVLNIKAGESLSIEKIEVTDINGRVIYINHKAGNSTEIQASDWTNGIYILKVFTDKGVHSEKIIK